MRIPIEQSVSAAARVAYPNIPAVAPIGVRVGKYMDVPESAKGPAIDPAQGYRIQELGKELYMVTDNIYQSMFMVYENGVVVIDVPCAIHEPHLFSSVSSWHSLAA